jgi:nucleoid DNA-binding protein
MPKRLTGLFFTTQSICRSPAALGIGRGSKKGFTVEQGNQAAGKHKPMNKTEIIAHLCEASGLPKPQVTGLLEELAKLIEKNLSEEGPGVFAIPNLVQFKVVRKPAVAEHTGVNPFTKQEMVFKAKPAKNVVKLVALKGLKDMVSKKSGE